MEPKAGASERKRGDQRDGCGKLLSATTDLLEPACKAGKEAGADENSVRRRAGAGGRKLSNFAISVCTAGH